MPFLRSNWWMLLICLAVSQHPSGANASCGKKTDVGFLHFSDPDTQCEVQVCGLESYSNWSVVNPSKLDELHAMNVVRDAVQHGEDYSACRKAMIEKRLTVREAQVCVRNAMAEINFGTLWGAIHVLGVHGNSRTAKLLHDSYGNYDGFNGFAFEYLAALSWKHTVVDGLSPGARVKWLADNWTHEPVNGRRSIEELVSEILSEEIKCSMGAGGALRAISAVGNTDVRIKALRMTIEDTHQRYSRGRFLEATIGTVLEIATDDDAAVRKEALSELQNVDLEGTSWLADLNRLAKSPAVSAERRAALLAALRARSEKRVSCDARGCQIDDP